MASLNHCTFIGNLGADPEVRRLPSGAPVANFRIACSESWKDKETGEKKESTEWISIVCFNEHLVPIIEQYLRKGSKCFVAGKFKTRKWTDQNGIEKYSSEIHLDRFGGQLLLLDSRGGGDGRSARDSQYDEEQQGRYGSRQGQGTVSSGRGGSAQSRDQGGGNRYSDLDDDIPF